MSHSSTDSSLLHQHRPNRLSPQPPSPTASTEVDQVRMYLENHESRHLPETFVSRTNSHTSLYPRSRSNSSSYSSLYQQQQQQPHASSSRLTSSSSSTSIHSSTNNTSSYNPYVDPPTSYISQDIAIPDFPSVPSSKLHHCRQKLNSVMEGSLGSIIPKDQWQPDSSSALCSYPLCTTIFNPSGSYFSTGPRRHHCRKCGKLFCNNHSSKKGLLEDKDKKELKIQRVCDLCVESNKSKHHEHLFENVEVLNGERMSRRSSSDTSESTEGYSIHTPNEQTYQPSIRSTSSNRAGSSRSKPTTPSGGAPTTTTLLAPIQHWMDRDGVISLYPLALPTIARKGAIPSAKPLFTPSEADQRVLREKEQKMYVSLRQRRLMRNQQDVPGWARTEVVEASDEE